MISILMKNNKDLLITQNAPIFQGEHLVDNLVFYIPNKYEDLELDSFDVDLKYKDQAKVSHTETLVPADEQTEEDYTCYKLPITNEISKFAGKINLSLSLTKVIDTDNSYILHTDEVSFNILEKEG